MRFLHEHWTRMSPKQEWRATLPEAKPAGRGPRRGRVKSIGSVEIPQEAFLAILRVGDE